MSILDALANVSPLADGDGTVNVLVETPTGSRDKFDPNHSTGPFDWSMQLLAGMTFPAAFGFVPGTLAEDGDPLDIALLVQGVFPQGVLVPGRPIGVLRARQDGDGEVETRNDRILAAPTLAQSFGDVRDVGELRGGYDDELAAFFRRYNELIGRDFVAEEARDRAAAHHMLREAIARHDAHG